MNKTKENLKKLKSFHNGSYGAYIDKAIKAPEQEIENLTPWDEGLVKMDGMHKVLENLDKLIAESEEV